MHLFKQLPPCSSRSIDANTSVYFNGFIPCWHGSLRLSSYRVSMLTKEKRGNQDSGSCSPVTRTHFSRARAQHTARTILSQFTCGMYEGLTAVATHRVGKVEADRDGLTNPNSLCLFSLVLFPVL